MKGRAAVVAFAYTGAGLDANREGQVGSALIASGRSLLTERFRDLLVTLLVLRERGIVTDPGRVAVVAHGVDGVMLLAAAPMLPPDVRLVLDRVPITYLAGAEIDLATPRLLDSPYHWTILPGLGLGHDLAGLLELAHPRRVLLTHPLDAAQQALGHAPLEAQLGLLTRTSRAHIEALTRERTRTEVLRRIVRSVTWADPDSRLP